MKVNRLNLLDQLNSVSPGLASKEIIEQSHCFVFHKGFVYTFNDQILCRQKSNAPIEGAVHAERLMTYLRKLTEPEIQMKIVDTNLEIKSKGTHAKIGVMKDIELPIDTVSYSGKWKTLPDDFRSAVRMVKGCASSSKDEFVLSCIHLTKEFMESCNNAQAIRYKCSLELKGEALVKADDLSQIAAANPIRYEEARQWIHFETDSGLILSCRKHKDEYEKLGPLFQVRGEKITLPKELQKGISRAKDFAEEIESRRRVTVSISKKSIQILGHDDIGMVKETVALVDYTGPEFKFNADPELISEMIENFPECRISSERMKASTKRFVFIAALFTIEED